MYKILSLVFLAILLHATPALSASKFTCPEKTLDTITLNGAYLGYFESEDFNSVGIRVENDDIYVVCSEEDANVFFGNSKGKQISLTYELQQFFIGNGADGECMRIEVCKSGKLASSAKTTNLAHSQKTTVYYYNGKKEEGAATFEINEKGDLTVSIDTVNPVNIATCEFYATCSVADTKITCVNDEMTDGIKGTLVGDVFTLTEGNVINYCGQGGNMFGKYILAK